MNKRKTPAKLNLVAELILADKERAFQNNEKEKRAAELLIATNDLIFQNSEKEKRAAELIIANKELIFQNTEKQKRAAELLIANEELNFQSEEKEKRAAELIIANKELIFQNREKEQRAAELIIANKELAFQNKEKEQRAAELLIANDELVFQNNEKGKRAAELIIANRELAFQNEEKEKRAAELLIANDELVFQNGEKEKRAAELIIANKELAFQNEEKEKRAEELIIANNALIFQNSEKGKRAAELIIANNELAFQNEEKEKRAAELLVANEELAFQNERMKKKAGELAALKEDLEREKYYLDSLMDTMPDAIYFKDRESKFLRVSKFMLKKHLWNKPDATVDDLIGRSDFDFKDQRHAKKAYADELEIQRTRKPKIDYIEKETLEDGSERWVATTKMPLINKKGDVVGTFGISRDVTKIKMLEKERHDALLDKAVAQGKFEIASGVMHDIGNAVVGFGSYLTRIRRLQNEDNPENLQNLATFLEKQKAVLAASVGEAKADAIINMLNSMALTQRATQEEINKIISEQLDIITNIEEILNIQRQYITGHESQERKPVDLRNIINDSLAMLFASLDKMAIAVSLDIPADLPIIKGDRTKLVQVLLNILKNSIEAIDITALEKTITLNAGTHDGHLILKVKDSGRGFDKSTADQLFTRGFTTKSSGCGMGLHNCRTIADSHECTIDIISEGHGKGALITIRFKI